MDMLGTGCPIIVIRVSLNSQMCTFLYILSLNKHWVRKEYASQGFFDSGTIDPWSWMTSMTSPSVGSVLSYAPLDV